MRSENERYSAVRENVSPFTGNDAEFSEAWLRYICSAEYTV